MLSAALLLAACSGDEPPPRAVGAERPAPVEEPPPTCPLTGVEISDEAVLDKPAVAVKIENSPQARPQTGLEHADVVFEEIVEGGITRFMAIYHCQVSDKVGPVRSARFDDPKFAKPFTSVLVYSGANATVNRELAAQGLVLVSEDGGSDGLFRDPPGTYTTHSLFADVKQVRRLKEVRKLDPPPADLFGFGELTNPSKKARRVTLNFTASNTIEYRWEGNAWARYEAGAPFMTAAGDQIAPANVLVLVVDVNASSTIVDVAGNPSPMIDFSGRGKALLFRDGSVVKGTWEVGPDGVPSFSDKEGTEMVFAPGSTWIELIPSQAGTVKGSFDFSKR
jgi:hypothetical protein